MGNTHYNNREEDVLIMTINETIYYGYGLVSGLALCFVYWIISKRKIHKPNGR